MTVAIEQVREAIGTDLGGSRFTIEPYEHWLTTDAVGSPPLPDGVAHPMFGYYGTQTGMRLSLAELFALVHARNSDGVMLGETTLTLHHPLEVGATYDVRGEIVDVIRKSGRRTGTFDVMTFRLELVDGDGRSVATATNSFIFPRRDDATQ